jgi:hypothetical protein
MRFVLEVDLDAGALADGSTQALYDSDYTEVGAWRVVEN